MREPSPDSDGSDQKAPMSYRERFLVAVEERLGTPVVWAAKGPDAYDCSGLVTACLMAVGGPDLRHLDNAQNLHDKTRLLVNETPQAGDLVFYGRTGPKDIVHVAVVDGFGGVVSADGATSHVTSLAVAMADEHSRVRRHASPRYRSDTKYIAVHRNVLIDVLDKVTR